MIGQPNRWSARPLLRILNEISRFHRMNIANMMFYCSIFRSRRVKDMFDRNDKSVYLFSGPTLWQPHHLGWNLSGLRRGSKKRWLTMYRLGPVKKIKYDKPYWGTASTFVTFGNAFITFAVPGIPSLQRLRCQHQCGKDHFRYGFMSSCSTSSSTEQQTSFLPEARTNWISRRQRRQTRRYFYKGRFHNHVVCI
jgi:hypothetical protein